MAAADIYIKKELDDCESNHEHPLTEPFQEETIANEGVVVKEEIDPIDNIFIEEKIDEANTHNGAISFHSVYIKEEINLPDFEPEMKLELEDDEDNEEIDDSNETLSAKQVLFKCSQCQKTFKRKNGLIKHMEVHSGLNLYRCQECNKYFTQFEFLLKHMQNVHKKEKPYHESVIKKKQFQCYFCEKAFDLVSALMRHEALHKGEEPFKCNKCQLSFPQKSDWSEHMRTNHIPGISYNCEDCPETFIKKMDLLRHMCDHRNKSADNAPVAGAAGRSRKKPTNEQPKKDFKCCKCGEVFISKYQLQEHLEVHAGIRPFQCTECKKAFKRKVDLKNHTSTYHSIKNKKKITCKCHLCGSSFSYSSSLSRHHTKGRCQFYNNF